jgi:hypothetical protein
VALSSSEQRLEEVSPSVLLTVSSVKKSASSSGKSLQKTEQMAGPVSRGGPEPESVLLRLGADFLRLGAAPAEDARLEDAEGLTDPVSDLILTDPVSDLGLRLLTLFALDTTVSTNGLSSEDSTLKNRIKYDIKSYEINYYNILPFAEGRRAGLKKKGS